MNQIIAWFARNAVAANLLLIFIMVAGAFTLSTIKKEVFPEASTEMISISVPYLGAAPEEVEEGVCIRVEEAVQGLEGIKRVSSTSAEGMGVVIVEAIQGTDTRKLLEEVKSRVDAISTFPAETEKPIVAELQLKNQVINVAISGDTDPKSLKHLGEQVRDDLLAISEISQVTLANTRPYEITIEMTEEALRRYNLTFDEVAAAVRRSSLDMPGGSIKTRGGEIMFRTKGQAYDGEQFENIVLRSLPDGTRLKIGDVGRVKDGFAETDQSTKFDGKPAVIVQVYRVGDESALDISAAVKAYIADARKKMPTGIKLTSWQDDTKILKSRLNLMVRNGRAGFILVFISLALFLRLRLAIWVSVGLVLSFFGAFWVIPWFDVSINLLSLFAFIVVLGIVVDDAIVVGENIYTHVEKGGHGSNAAIAGAQQVATPVIFAVLTTIAAFSPLLMVPGNMGKFMRVIPIIVIATLIFSLIESLLILPAHLRHLTPDSGRESGSGITLKWRQFQDKFTGFMKHFVNNHYAAFLEKALKWRYTCIAIGVSVLIVMFGVTSGGWIKFTFFPNVDADNVVAYLTMPQGVSPEKTQVAIERLEKTALQLQKEYSPDGKDNIIQHILASIGDQPFRVRQERGPGRVTASYSAAHLGEVNLQLKPSEERTVTSAEIARRWRELTGPIPEAVEQSFTYSIFSAGSPISIQLSGNNNDELRAVANELKAGLAEYPGVFDISDSFRAGKQEIKLKIKPEAESLGLTLFDLAKQVRQAFFGEEAQRIQRDRDDVRVMVRYPEEERKSLGDLENMRIRLPRGDEVPFSVTADAKLGKGFAAISRTDRMRNITVTADVDESKGNANEINASVLQTVLPEILARHSSVSYSLEGAQKEQAETLGGLAEGFMLAILVIYILLAIPFKSYSQPFIVMSAIPFGIVGAVLGHLMMGMDLTVLSMFGIVALTGVVVNDSLVMVDFINKSRLAGKTLKVAIRDAGVARFRPILLTSVTTFLGLTPLLLEKSVQAQFLVPMAISLGFGVIFATLITLILVPVSYLILEDGKAAAFRLIGKVPTLGAQLLGEGKKQIAGTE